MSPDSVKASYRATLKEQVTIRRYTGVVTATSPRFDVTARARVVGFEPKELIGSILQGDRKAIVYADDLIEGGLTLPVRTTDKLLLASGKELAIISADGDSRKVDGVLIAYELQVRG